MVRAFVLVGVVSSAVLAPVRAAHAGACAEPQIPTRPLTKDGAELAPSGGVLLSTEDAAKPPRWQFASGAKKVAAKPRAIGAGLFVFEPPAAGAWTLVDDKGANVVAIKRAAAKPQPPAAPKVMAMTRTMSSTPRGTYVRTVVEVDGAPPAEAAVLVVLDDKGKVLSWGAARGPDVTQKRVAITVYMQGRCMAYANGTMDSAGGDKVGLAWIDDSGRMSPATRATVVAKQE